MYWLGWHFNVTVHVTLTIKVFYSKSSLWNIINYSLQQTLLYRQSCETELFCVVDVCILCLRLVSVFTTSVYSIIYTFRQINAMDFFFFFGIHIPLFNGQISCHLSGWFLFNLQHCAFLHFSFFHCRFANSFQLPCRFTPSSKAPGNTLL